MNHRIWGATRGIVAIAALALALPAVALAQDEIGGRGSTITGRVEVEGVGTPSERLEVIITRASGGGSRRVFTDSGGTFIVNGMRPGNYILSVRPPIRTGYAEGSAEISIDDTLPSSLTVTILLQRKANEPSIFSGGRVFSAKETDHSVPKQARSLYKKGTAAARDNRRTEAIALFEQALQIAPTYLFALNDLGVQYTREGRFTDSIAVLRRAIAVAPTSFPPHLNVAIALFGLGSYQEAANETELALGIDPTASDALYLSGVLARRLGNSDAAIAAFQKAFDQGGADAVFAQFELGQLYEQGGQAVAAARAYRLFLQFVSTGPQAEYARERLRVLAHA